MTGEETATVVIEAIEALEAAIELELPNQEVGPDNASLLVEMVQEMTGLNHDVLRDIAQVRAQASAASMDDISERTGLDLQDDPRFRDSMAASLWMEGMVLGYMIGGKR